MAVGLREVRAIVLIAGALLAIAAVSFAYLRPPAAPPLQVAAPAIGGPSGDTWSQSVLVQNINLTGRTDGGYFTWERPGSGSGGHAA